MSRIKHFTIYTIVYTAITIFISYLFGSNLSIPVFIIFLFLGYFFSLWLENHF